MSAIPDLKLSDDALAHAHAQLAAAAIPVIVPATPATSVLASVIVAGALGEVEPVLQRARTGLAVAASAAAADVANAADTFTQTDARLAGGVP